MGDTVVAVKPDVCSGCKKINDFTEKFLKFEEIENDLTFPGEVSKKVKEYCDQFEEDSEMHGNFYMNTKLYMKYVNIFKLEENQDILEEVVRKVKLILNTLQLIDRGCSKLMGNYLMILME